VLWIPQSESVAVEKAIGGEYKIIEFPFNNDPWLDNGLEYLHKILIDNREELGAEIQVNNSGLKILTSDNNRFSEQLGIAIKNIRQNLVVWGEDNKTGEKKEIKKDFILIQEGTKVGGIVAFKEDIYSQDKVVDTVKRVIELAYKDGNETCIVCGGKFYKPYKKLQQASYPFVTKIKSLSGIRSYKDGEMYSFKEYFENFCPRCYLLGILVWADTGLIYRTFPGGKAFVFLPRMSSLRDLIDFKESYRELLNPSERYSNLRVRKGSNEVENTPGEYSTLLCFYERFFSEIEDTSNYATQWFVVQIPLGTVKNVKYDNISLKQDIIDVLREIVKKEEISIYADIIKEIYFFNDNLKGSPVEITRDIQEKLSEYFLKDDFRHFTKQLLPRKGGHVGFSRESREDFETLIYMWRWKRMGIPKENLDTIKSVGNIIAVASKNNLSLLYKLDKARNLNEFWSVLREISRKIVGFDEGELFMIKPTALDGLIQLVKTYEDQWKEIRDLLVVYSSMYYSIKSRAGGAVK
jgi:hypothetical protein